MVRNQCLNPKKLKTPTSKVPPYTVDDLIKMVAVEALTKTELKERAVKSVGMSDSKFYELYRELEGMDGVTLILFDCCKGTAGSESP
jgi:ACT domain-containing protein